jgi:hypothetical protein
MFSRGVIEKWLPEWLPKNRAAILPTKNSRVLD